MLAPLLLLLLSIVVIETFSQVGADNFIRVRDIIKLQSTGLHFDSRLLLALLEVVIYLLISFFDPLSENLLHRL